MGKMDITKSKNSEMMSKLKFFKNLNISNEKEQALIRVLMGLAICIYTLTPDFSLLFRFPEMPGVVYISTSYLFSTLLLLMAVIADLASGRIRRRLAMLIDITALSLGMIVATEIVSPLFFIYLWVIIGFGFRFGEQDLLYATGLSIVGFSVALYFGEFNDLLLRMSIGNLIALLLLPTYIYVLLRRLKDKRIKLKEALERADAANESKSRFIANVSHELRTPLNGVIGGSELLINTKLSDEQKEYTNIINNSAHILHGLIKNILDISKIEAGEFKLDENVFNVEDLLLSVETIIRPLALNKGLTIGKNISDVSSLYLIGDDFRIKQILLNLGNNAIKFTEKGQVTFNIFIKTETEQEATLVFEVIDTGIGIPKEKQKFIFERFKQADDGITRKYGGTGLGTNISKQLVELMGGRIGFISEENRGSRFWFELTLSKAIANEKLYLDKDVIIYSNTQSNIKTWSKLFSQWDMGFGVLDSKDDLEKVISSWNNIKKERYVIIDDTSLNCHPDEFIGNLTIKYSTKIIHMLARHAVDLEEYEVCKYDKILSLPIDSRELYQAIHYKNVNKYDGEKVASITQFTNKRLSSNVALNILVIDDQETNRFILKKILGIYNHNVELVENGEDALDALSEKDYDLVLLDLHMPDISGVEVIKHFQFMKPNSTTPFVIITADARKVMLDEIKNIVAGYLTKPINHEKLIEVINNIISNNNQLSSKTEEAFEYKHKADYFNKEEFVNSYDDLLLTEDFMKALFNQFYTDADRILDGMAIDIENRDYANIRDKTHALYGISGNVCASRLTEILSAFGDLPKDEQIYNKAIFAFKEMRQCLDKTRQEMTAFITELNASKKR